MPPVAFEIDPTSENASNVPLSLTDATIRLLEMEIPPPAINPMYATSADTEGDRFVDSRYVNRIITLTLLAKGTTDALTQTAVNNVQQKIEKLRRDGGTLKFTTQAGTTVVADVNFARMTPEITKELYVLNKAVKFTLEFDCAPFLRGTPTQLADHVETNIPVLIWTETAIPGDVPALGSLVVDNDQVTANIQNSVIVGWQSKNYSATASAGLWFEAEDMTALNGATATAVTSASGTAVQKTGVWDAWIGVLSTQASGGGAQKTHKGTYRVIARASAGNASQTVEIALEWGVGDLTSLTRNTPVELDSSQKFMLCDLGLIYIRPEAASWQGRVIARQTSSLTFQGIVNVDWLMFIPVDEGSGVASANPIPAAASSPNQFDAFATITGGAVLNARTGTSGSTWTTGVTTGAASDFVTNVASFGNGNSAYRTVSNDTGARFATYGASITGAVDVTTDLLLSDTQSTENGLIARWSSANTHVRFTIVNHNTAFTVESVRLAVITGGLVSQAVTAKIPTNIGRARTLRLVIDASGSAFGIISYRGGPMLAVLSLFDTALATGGTHANGNVGFYDFNNTAVGTAPSEYHGLYASNSAATDAAMFQSKSLTLTSSAVTRTDRTSSSQSSVAYEGDYLRVPQAGKENRTVRFIVKGSRGFINSASPGDTSPADDISARLTVTPRYLMLPP